MNWMLSTLLDLMQLVSLNRQQSRIIIAPLQDILKELCTPALSLEQIQLLSTELEGYPQQGRYALSELLRTVEPLLAERSAAFSAAQEDIQQLLMLHTALMGHLSVRPLQLQLQPVMRYLQLVQFDAQPQSERVVLVGDWLPAKESISVPLNNPSGLLRWMHISYDNSQDLPLLKLKLWSRSKVLQTDSERIVYQQPGEDWRLQVWPRHYTSSAQNGYIETQVITEPYVLQTQKVELHLAPKDGAVLLETSVIEGQDKRLLTCLLVRYARLVHRSK